MALVKLTWSKPSSRSPYPICSSYWLPKCIGNTIWSQITWFYAGTLTFSHRNQPCWEFSCEKFWQYIQPTYANASCLAEPGKGCCGESCRPRQAQREGRELLLSNGARTSQNVCFTHGASSRSFLAYALGGEQVFCDRKIHSRPRQDSPGRGSLQDHLTAVQLMLSSNLTKTI